MMNDLWAYNFEKDNWVLMKNDIDQEVLTASTFDHRNEYDSLNTPGARMNANGFVFQHEFYLFGGVYRSKHFTDLGNDFWKFEIPQYLIKIQRLK